MEETTNTAAIPPQDQNKHGMGCMCGICYKPYSRRMGGFFFVRMVVGLIILFLVFVAGIKIGELHSYRRGVGFTHSYGAMRHAPNRMRGYPTADDQRITMPVTGTSNATSTPAAQ